MAVDARGGGCYGRPGPRDAIRRALEQVGGNRRLAAERLGMGERTLYDKLKRYGIS